MKGEKRIENDTIKQILYSNTYDTEVVRKTSLTNNEQGNKGRKKNKDGQNSHMFEKKTKLITKFKKNLNTISRSRPKTL
jgi:hypothetical protein